MFLYPNLTSSLSIRPSFQAELQKLLSLLLISSLLLFYFRLPSLYSAKYALPPIPSKAAITNFKSSTLDQASKAKITENFGKIPLSFEANRGQADNSVKFISRGSGYTLFLTGTEAIFNLSKNKDSSSVVRMQLQGAQLNPQISGVDELQGKSNYFIGSDQAKWETNVSTFGKVKYDSVYPGVDLVYYGNQGQLEYDFTVKPAADPSNIALAFSGADKLEISNEGNILLHLGGDVITLKKPVLYQDINGGRQEVSGNFILSGDKTVKFNIGNYNSNYELVIDPVLEYSTYLGGSLSDGAVSIAVDTAGNAYITGSAHSLNFPTTNPYQGSHAPGTPQDIFISKLNPAGNGLIYSTYLGGTGEDVGLGIQIDLSGNAYVTGYTGSADFPTTNPFQSTLLGQFDIFVTKLSASGSTLLYSTYLGGSGVEYEGDSGDKIAVDALGNAYVVGSTRSVDFPIVGGFQALYSGQTDAFVAKISSSGTSLIYSTYLGGVNMDEGVGIAIDMSSYIYVTGRTEGNFPIINAIQASRGGLFDAFVTKIDPAISNPVYSTYIGGSNNEKGLSIAVDSASNVYITGDTQSMNFPTANALQSSFGGGSHDAFVTKLNSAGTAFVYSTYLGGSNGIDQGTGIDVDGAGHAIVAGWTDSVDFPTTNPIQASNHGSNDVFVTKLNPSGSAFEYSTYMGGSTTDAAIDVAVDSSGNVYVTGLTQSGNFPTINAFQSVKPGVVGNNSGFIFKISDNQPPTVDAGGAYNVNEGSSVQVFATGNDPENGPLIYAWDLDNNGSFETPGQSATFSAVGLDGPSSYTIAVRVTDDGSLTATDTATVNIVNVAPSLGTITAPIDPIPVNTTILTSASFTDTGTPDTHTAIWDWGNGTSPGLVNQVLDTVTGTHTYTTPGVYTLKLSVTDDDGGFGESLYQFVVVYDNSASGGFVTGAGSIDSPLGAYTANPSLTGIARFGFISKYQPGATVPTGDTQFRFQVAQFTFSSTSYDWLVVAGAQAKYKGVGTVNGSGNYGFLLSGTDGVVNGGGGVDKFRIKIWDRDNNDTVVYDNQLGAGESADPTTAITGGNIIIH